MRFGEGSLYMDSALILTFLSIHMHKHIRINKSTVMGKSY